MLETRKLVRAVLFLTAFVCLNAVGVFGQGMSKYIVVDQFGYLPDAKKIAVLRDPQTGLDAAESFTPGNSYAVVDKTSQEQVFTGTPSAWNSGATDISSGDKVWWFDFSSVTEAGTYYISDVNQDLRSYEFEISEAVYNDVLRHAVRTFFYQRVGFPKAAQYAGAGWADGASHTGNLQDNNARVYNAPGNAATEMDVSGGWYDAGDYNKYTNWTANYIVDFMRAYLENPAAWGDDYNIPESGNGIPDLLDEAKWGVDHLLRMQKEDGSMLSIVGLSHASPPSSATGPSLYGTPNTSSTWNSAGAFAIASKVYELIGMTTYANTLKESAIKAWDWAEANPDVIFKNNDSASGTSGLGAGQQEMFDDEGYGRFAAKTEAAVFLFEITGEEKYRDFFDDNYQNINMMEWNFAFPFQNTNQETLLHYTTLPGATPDVAADIKDVYKNAMNNGGDNFPAFYNFNDPYRAFLSQNNYTWGSNSTKMLQGLMYLNIINYDIDATKNEDALDAAKGYIHYIHGVNPLNMTYLSNMYDYGGDNCVNEFYHTWFSNGSPKWDRVGVSTYGPPPGFLTGGPNPSYDWDGCCPSGCGGDNNAVCTSESISPPKNQPHQKSYKDFNTSWPLNSWSVTENSNGYQINYIRLLSRFVDASYDCSGTKDGEAFIDACGQCAGGNTGITPITEVSECPQVITDLRDKGNFEVSVYPNPSGGSLFINSSQPGEYQVEIIDIMGKKLFNTKKNGTSYIDISGYRPGIYTIFLNLGNFSKVEKIIKQ